MRRMARNNVLKTRPMQLMERRTGVPLEETLRKLYHEQGMTLAEVAGVLGVTSGTVSRWMGALGIEARFPGQRGSEAA